MGRLHVLHVLCIHIFVLLLLQCQFRITLIYGLQICFCYGSRNIFNPPGRFEYYDLLVTL